MLHDRCPAGPAAFADAAKLFGEYVDDLIPPEAFVHLHNAEKELLLAVAVTFTYHAEMKAQAAAAAHAQSGEHAARHQHPVKISLDD